MTIISNTIRAAARASVPNRALSSTPAAPRMHKAKDAWKDIAATRPHEGHPHVSCNNCQRVCLSNYMTFHNNIMKNEFRIMDDLL